MAQNQPFVGALKNSLGNIHTEIIRISCQIKESIFQKMHLEKAASEYEQIHQAVFSV